MTTETKTTALAVVRNETAMASTGGSLLRPIARPKEILEAIDETTALIKQTLRDGTDYGTIPGTNDRKVLLKPGAEKITVAFGCRPEFDILESQIDLERVMRWPVGWVEAPDPGRAEKEKLKAANKGRSRKVNGEWVWQVPGNGFEETIGLYRYTLRCTLRRFDGTVVGQGVGACSSLESKYRSRPHDVENTVFKMAKKRAHVDAVLSAFGLSGMFTQDVGDPETDPPPPEEKKPAPPADPKMTAETYAAIRAELVRLQIEKQQRTYLESHNHGEPVESEKDAQAVLEKLRRLPDPAREPGSDG